MVTVIETRSKMTQSDPKIMGPLSAPPLPRQACSSTGGLPDLSAPGPRSDSHTDRPARQQKLDSAPGRERERERDITGKIRCAFHRDLHPKKGCFCCFGPVLLGAPMGGGGIYLVTLVKHLLPERQETQLDNCSGIRCK